MCVDEVDEVDMARKTIFTGHYKRGPDGRRRFTLVKVQTEQLTIEASGTLSCGSKSKLIIPHFATADIPEAAAANEGMLVYDTTLNVLKVSNGVAWLTITAA
ncbi:MAG: hypothetical protein GX552_07865 [Chloroflexi bacterium]|nr:hypothetical protein [Chloroflexota bacterium]